MFKYVIKRILLAFLTLFVILSICFIFVKLLPLENPKGTEAQIKLIYARREAMGYNKPILEQLWLFWQRVITRFDWGMGETLYPAQEVITVIGKQLPSTIMVNVYSVIFSVPIGLAFGIFAAIKKNKWQDHTISTLVMVVISVPSFIYAFLIKYLLCFKLQLFPVSGMDRIDPDANIWAQLLQPHMIYSLMPAILSLSFGSIAGYTRFTRAELSEVLTSDYMLLARTKGLTRQQATVRHALRNAMVVIFPSILGEFIGVLGGSLIIESMFGIPGIGSLYIDSINNLDYNFFMAVSAFYTAIGLFANIIGDLSYGFIDPRIKMGAR